MLCLYLFVTALLNLLWHYLLCLSLFNNMPYIEPGGTYIEPVVQYRGAVVVQYRALDKNFSGCNLLDAT